MLSILVVEDDDAVLVNLQTYFEDEGYHVYTAKTAEQAFTLLRTQEIGVILIEVRIPGIDIHDLIQEGLHLHPGLKVFIHTASADYHLSEQLKALGISSEQVFFKSYTTLEKLADQIREQSLD